MVFFAGRVSAEEGVERSPLRRLRVIGMELTHLADGQWAATRGQVKLRAWKSQTAFHMPTKAGNRKRHHVPHPRG